MYELAPINNEILVQENEIVLVGYDDLIAQLDKLGEYLCSVEVTPENIKENKKLVAQVRNACKKLNDEKIAFRKEYVKPLDTLYAQVKEIDRRAKEYEEQVRVQIREFEEQEREQKEDKIRVLFHKKLRPYGGKDVQDLFKFENFMKAEYLRKTFPMNQIEKDMAEFLEQTTEDINALVVFSESVPQEKDDIVLYYLDCGNVSETITHFNKLNEQKEKVKESLVERKVKPTQAIEEHFLIKLNMKDYAKTTNLLRAAGIDFELV